MSASAVPTPEFFARLAALPTAAAVSHAFERLFPSTAALSRSSDLTAELYRGMLVHLLDGMGVPRSAGGLNWEWRPLLVLFAEADPHYFTEQQLARRLGECPPLSPTQRTVLLHALRGFLELRKTGLLEHATPWVPEALQHAWIGLFPAASAWSALNMLRGAGLVPVGSAAGWRCFRRFTAGEFDPPITPETLRAWQDVCWGGKNPPPLSQVNAAHRFDFDAAAHAGDFAAAGLAGPCGAVPRCDACGLREQCAWARIGDPSRAAVQDGASAAARARTGQLEEASLEHLLDGLFGFDAAERERIARGLRGETLRSLATKSAIELEEWLGLDGQATRAATELNAERLLLLFEVCRRFGEERLIPGRLFTQARDVHQHFRLRFRDLKQERFLVVLLDVKKRYLGDVMISLGHLTEAPVHPREVFAAAVRERAAFVLLVHNHPSGDPAPSKADLETTRHLAQLGELMGIPVLDHVILGDERFVSLRESGQVSL